MSIFLAEMQYCSAIVLFEYKILIYEETTLFLFLNFRLSI